MLGLSALVEAHDEREVQMAVDAKSRIIGVNNRNLKDFSVDTDNSRRLREQIPTEILFVSESGVQSAKDVKKLREIGADAVLIGETLMRAADKKDKAERTARCDMTKIKLCGLRRVCDIEAANALHPEYVGFVFAAKSRRYISPEKVAELRKYLQTGIQVVGVFVNEEPKQVAGLLNSGVIDIAQLHGEEDNAYIKILTKDV